MRATRLLLFSTALAIVLDVIPAARPQPVSEKSHAGEKAAGERDMSGWQWANFIVLVGVLAYFGVKLGKPYFAAQSEALSRDLTDARLRRTDAEHRTAEVEQRLSNLDADVARFRKLALDEQKAHMDSMRTRLTADLDRIRVSAEQQIETASKNARNALRRHASQLALELAEQRLRDQMAPPAHAALTHQFVESLGAPQ